jgi:hypothetical protein
MSSRKLPVKDFYKDFTTINFGEEANAEIAEIFISLDNFNPVSVAMNCPTGSLHPYHQTIENPYTTANSKTEVPDELISWEIASKDFWFVEKMESIRTKIKGNGNIERFDFWLNTFRYHKQILKVRYTLSLFEIAMKNLKKQAGFEAQYAFAYSNVIPVYTNLLKEFEMLVTIQMNLVSTNGGIANIVNIMNHKDFYQMVVENPANALKEIIGNDLPQELIPHRDYKGKSRIFMTTVKTNILEGESLIVKVNSLSKSKPTAITLNWRPLGGSIYSKIPLNQVNNGIYDTIIDSKKIAGKDFEYFIEASFGDGTIFYPPSAKEINNTVIVLKK